MVLNKMICSLLALALCSAVMVGCGSSVPPASTQTTENQRAETNANSDDAEAEIGYPDSYLVTAENHFDYQPGLECAAFSSAYVLRHFGEDADGLTLFEDFPGKLPDGNGVYPSGVEQFWDDLEGYSAEFKSGGTVDELKRLVSTGVPVIVFIHVEEPYTTTHNTHYLPLIGYDEEYFYFAESLDYLANCKDEPDLDYNRKTEISKFERLWSDIDGVWNQPYFVIMKDEAGGMK